LVDKKKAVESNARPKWSRVTRFRAFLLLKSVTKQHLTIVKQQLLHASAPRGRSRFVALSTSGQYLGTAVTLLAALA
jgi:hypothetical protein